MPTRREIFPEMTETQGGLDTLWGGLKSLPGKFTSEAPMFMAGLKALYEDPRRVAELPHVQEKIQQAGRASTGIQDILQGRLDPRSEEGIQRIYDAASLATDVSGLASAPAGSLAAGAPRRTASDLDKLKRLYQGAGARTPVQDWSYELAGATPTMAPVKTFDVNQLKTGDTLIPAFHDRSRVSAPLVGVGGEQLGAAVTAEGGPDFMRANPNIWASERSIVTNLANKAKQGEGTPYLVTSAMGPTSIDYSHHAWEPLLWQSEKLPKATREAFDKEFRQKYPQWPGLGKPEQSIQMLQERGPMRTPFMSQLGDLKWQKEGLPEPGPVRWAMTEPDLRGVQTGASGYGISRIDPRVITDPAQPHTSYAAQLPGTYEGRAESMLPWQAYWRDFAARPDVAKQPTSNQLYTLRLNTPVQTVDQQLIDDLGRRLEAARRGP